MARRTGISPIGTIIVVGIVCILGATAWVGAGIGRPDPTPGPAGPKVTKLLVFVIENHSYGQMRSRMPYLRELAATYGTADHYDALTHPSLPNYLAFAGGETFGVTDDKPPADHPISARSVFGNAVASGKTSRIYVEGMSANCQHESQGRYAVKHNPWPYFRSEASACERDDVPLSRLASDVNDGRLPTVGLVVPDLCSDGHDCPLLRPDRWLSRQIRAVLAGPDWRSGTLAVVVTADEDDSHHRNRVLTVVAHPSLRHVVVTTHLNHYALSRAYSEVSRTRALGEAKHFPSLLTAFGLDAG